MTSIPRLPGTYALILRLAAPQTLTVGRLGRAALPVGWAVYIGSAHGPGGLHARTARHLRRNKAIHWHIDALTTQVPVSSVWYSAVPERLECHWARIAAASPNVSRPVPGFGASDCNCQTHLFSLPDDGTTLHSLWQRLERPTWIKP
jgi:Uri superfamily endonuclease